MQKKNILLILSFLLLFSSLFTNIWRITDDKDYRNFDIFNESFILGKLSRSDKEGIFHNSGFYGVNYNKSSFPDYIVNNCHIDDSCRVEIAREVKYVQKNIYDKKIEMPDSYCPYLSQIGGAGYLYTVINKILPFQNSINYHIIRLINVLLITACFFVFLFWVHRNFGCISALVTFILLFLSSWIVLYSGKGLWWSLWNFYLPFLTMLLTLEKRNSGSKKTTENTIFILLFLAVFIKCFFTGFEFITVSLLSAFCPIVYYFWLEKTKFSAFIYFSFKIGVISLLAVFAYMFIYVIQLYSWFGNINEVIEYIFFSYKKRTGLSINNNAGFIFVISYIIKEYLGGNAFKWGFVTSDFQFHFRYLYYIIIFSSVIISIITNKINNRKYTALILSTVFSVLCPLSWFIIFRNHSYNHPHLDYIVWYIPSLALGFSIIGVGLSLAISKIRGKVIS